VGGQNLCEILSAAQVPGEAWVCDLAEQFMKKGAQLN
jgi:hypothetical protein